MEFAVYSNKSHLQSIFEFLQKGLIEELHQTSIKKNSASLTHLKGNTKKIKLRKKQLYQKEFYLRPTQLITEFNTRKNKLQSQLHKLSKQKNSMKITLAKYFTLKNKQFNSYFNFLVQ